MFLNTSDQTSLLVNAALSDQKNFRFTRTPLGDRMSFHQSRYRHHSYKNPLEQMLYLSKVAPQDRSFFHNFSALASSLRHGTNNDLGVKHPENRNMLRLYFFTPQHVDGEDLIDTL